MAMKVLVLFSSNSGSSRILKKKDDIKTKLAFSLNGDIIEKLSHSVGEAQDLIHQACVEHYHSIIIVGGDGSWNLALNTVMKESYRPVLGYLNGGTLGDCGKHLGISKNLSRSLKVISPNHIRNIDIGKANQTYFSYFFAYGAYSDIPYLKQRKKGVLTYYKLALKEAFTSQNHVFVIDGQKIKSPFIMALLGNHAAGFKIASKDGINDGKFDFYLTKPGIFNGLGHYLFEKKKMLTRKESFQIETDGKMAYCLDGEKVQLGKSVELSVIPNALSVYSR